MSQFSEHRIIQQYQAGECTPEEEIMIEAYIIFIGTTSQNLRAMRSDLDELHLRTVGPLVVRIKTRESVRLVKIGVVASSISILMGLGALFLALSKDNLQIAYINDVDSGSDKATLTLADGTRINLSHAKNGSLLKQSGIQIVKTEDGTLVYKVAAPKSNISAYNTITTPKGGQYKIILPDGTKVWLNSASSLSYHTSSNDIRGYRKVRLIGEAYFEVAKSDRKPFIVKTHKQEIIVLGTQFNVNCYKDEPNTKTTLLEGAIRISSPHGKIGKTILKPGDQAINNGDEIRAERIDTSLAIAWKNQEFVFQNESLESIMRKVGRWYNVEIVYENNEVAKELFGGTISRYDKISKALRALENTGDVRFRIQDRKILITK